MSNLSNNKRIAKNTVFMYLRMIITMCVGLYTSRAVLHTLGVEDFGLYNVIGGIVSLFMVVNSAMVNTTSRYITVYLAKNDNEQTTNIFSMSLLVHVAIAIIVVVLCETVGWWYIHNKLVVPEGRMFAAEWLFHLSIITSAAAILYVPYNASIIAHEKMGTFAFVQIMDSFVKLAIVLMLAHSPWDKLISYATLFAALSIVDLLIYVSYCRRHFIETKFRYYWNRSVFKEMMGFTGWAVVGNFNHFFYTQGINLMLNAFGGPAVNAARGIAVQVENVVKQFANNVQVAINPQILKTYATNELERMYSLIIASSKYCFFLLFLISLPILIETDFILNLWLVEPPTHTASFVRIVLITTIFDAFVNPMFTANLASGKLMLYHLPLSILMYGFMFITYLSIKLTNVPESVFISYFVAVLIGYVMKIYILERQVGLKKVVYLRQVLYPVCLVVVSSIIIPLIIYYSIEEGWLRFLFVGIVCVVSVMACVFWFGISQSEKQMVVGFLRRKIYR